MLRWTMWVCGMLLGLALPAVAQDVVVNGDFAILVDVNYFCAAATIRLVQASPLT